MKHFLLPSLILLTGLINCSQPPQKSAIQDDYYVAAYIWPSCHDDPMAREKLWPAGIGEWEVIQKGNPRYEGHYQPKEPLWGFELDNDPEVVEKWIDVATDHGVNVFIYDWYWYDQGPYLESALNDGFLKAKNNEKMYFYIMWANHDVRKNYWNYHLYGDDNSILWDAAVDRKNFEIIVERVIRQYFHRPNYFKIDGQPVFAIFDYRKLMQSFDNSVEETRKALDYFREEARKAGFPGVHFQWIPGGGSLRTPEAAQQEARRIEALGFNSVTMYNMGGMAEDYIVYGSNSVKIREQWDEVLNIPFFPCTSVGWDDTPRFPQYGKNNTVHINNTPESFATLLSKAKRFIDNHPDQPKLMTINAWNECVEGSYLLPDMKYGFSYLEAVKDVMDGKYDRYTIKNTTPPQSRTK
ncbi:MAG: glycoside hydrolase family 99-like domain-containing protein [Tannerella sp.]|nr:glycoside hydrolase family 99-like domain-containing protein [Tannerella sp.]